MGKVSRAFNCTNSKKEVENYILHKVNTLSTHTNAIYTLTNPANAPVSILGKKHSVLFIQKVFIRRLLSER